MKESIHTIAFITVVLLIVWQMFSCAQPKIDTPEDIIAQVQVEISALEAATREAYVTKVISRDTKNDIAQTLRQASDTVDEAIKLLNLQNQGYSNKIAIARSLLDSARRMLNERRGTTGTEHRKCCSNVVRAA